MDTPIGKPALLRQTFELRSAYSGELLSLNKMLGSLHDAGNSVTLAGYINLLNECGLLCAIQKFSIDRARRRASIPKLQVYNNALKMVYNQLDFENSLLNFCTLLKSLLYIEYAYVIDISIQITITQNIIIVFFICTLSTIIPLFYKFCK